MKKSLKYFSILLALTLLLTGCKYGKDAKNDFTKALDKNNELKSLKEKVNITASFNSEGKKVDIELSGDLDAYKESADESSVHGKLKVGAMGTSYDTELYMNSNKEGYGLYLSLLGQWMKLEQKYSADELKQIEQYKEMFKGMKGIDYTKVLKSVKTTKSDKKGYTKLDVVIGKDKLNDEIKVNLDKIKDELLNNLKKYNTDSDYKEIEKEYNDSFKKLEKGIFSKDIKFNAYLKDGYVSIVKIDCAAIVNSLLDGIKDIDGADELVKDIKKLDLKLDITVEMSDFDKVEKITVPEAAKKGTDMSEYLNFANKLDF